MKLSIEQKKYLKELFIFSCPDARLKQEWSQNFLKEIDDAPTLHSYNGLEKTFAFVATLFSLSFLLLSVIVSTTLISLFW